ncbi:PKD domain-containing protein [Amycolatopsis rhabdoformis]|uniref:PKD domain-containing protein n=1 Tax=Amycolatopsis rhabdoformis TaxID=1448059 RepID=A0ABZ1I5W1_9PSEU|nr:PKD domain-containing protein [Amycolatopsis rhabdoformis]WSE29775.1 PKD domain-containing protein [Amycolatopsis rhabdoformis]
MRPRLWAGAVPLAVAALAMSAIPAAAVTGNLPGGTSMSVTLASPAEDTVIPQGPATVTGTASVGTGAAVKDTGLTYVLDVSGSTGSGCSNTTVLGCEIAAAKALNNDAAVPNTVIGSVGAAVFGTGSATADVGPAAGEQTLTTPTADANGNGARDINEVLDSAVIGGIGKFTAKNFPSGTDFTAGISAAKTVTDAQTENRKIVVFLSDGAAVGDVRPPLSTVPANVTYYTFAVGAGSSCAGGSYESSLQAIADLTGGTCTAVPDPANLPNVLPGVIDSQLTALTLSVDGGGAIPVTNVTPGLPRTGPASVTYSVATGNLAPGRHELCVTAHGTDGGGPGTVADCTHVIVNAPPVVVAGGPYAGQEGTAVSLAGTVTDPDGQAGSRHWSIAPGAGVDAGATCSFGNAAALSTTVTCDDDGTYTLTLTADDGINPPVARTAALTLTNVAPAVHITAPTTDTVFNHGAAVAVTAPFTDIGHHDTHTCTVDYADGSALVTGSVTESAGAGNCSASHAYTVSGTYNVLVRVTDDDGGAATAIVRIIVNDPPVVVAGGPYAGQEGTAVSLAGTVTDPDGPSLATHWTATPQSGVDSGTSCTFGNPAALSTTVTCDDDGVWTLTLSADDSLHPAVLKTTTLTLTNVAPHVSISAPADGQLVLRGAPIGVTAPFTDIGTHDTHTCTVDFADGSPVATGAISETPGSGTCTASHTYTGVGAHNVLVTVTDDDGDSATAVVKIVSYVRAEAWSLSASGLINVSKTPLAGCPPNSDHTTATVNVLGLASVQALHADCTLDASTGRTNAGALVSGASLLGGVISLKDIQTSCVADGTGLHGSSRVGTLNGQPIGTGPATIGIPGVATVHLNETVTGPNGQLAQYAVRVVTLLGQEIVLSGCRMGF